MNDLSEEFDELSRKAHAPGVGRRTSVAAMVAAMLCAGCGGQSGTSPSTGNTESRAGSSGAPDATASPPTGGSAGSVGQGGASAGVGGSVQDTAGASGNRGGEIVRRNPVPGSVGLSPGAIAGVSGVPIEECYVATSRSEEARLTRNTAGVYRLVATTLRTTLTVDEKKQELWLGSEFASSSFSARLAPDGSIADATFWSCWIPPQQISCFGPMPVATSLTDCAGNAVSVPSASGCYEQHGGGLRLELAGAPGSYTALVSQRGGAASAWLVRESSDYGRHLIISAGPDGPSLQFTMGATGRVLAMASFSRMRMTESMRFVSCL